MSAMIEMLHSGSNWLMVMDDSEESIDWVRTKLECHEEDFRAFIDIHVDNLGGVSDYDLAEGVDGDDIIADMLLLRSFGIMGELSTIDQWDNTTLYRIIPLQMSSRDSALAVSEGMVVFKEPTEYYTSSGERMEDDL